MKTTNLFKAVAFVAMVIASIMNSEVKAQGHFITNEEVQNDLVVAKTIFKQDGSYLYNHMRYEFTYDNENRLAVKTASKWDGVKDEWIPYFKMSYRYNDNEIIISYARWNEKHRAYDKDVKKSVYEMNEENMPVAYRSYEQSSGASHWTLVSYNRVAPAVGLLAITE